MKILTAEAIRRADLYTIEHEPVDSIDLMERAAGAIAHWIFDNVAQTHSLLFCAGKGNNGGDGLAVARMAYHAGYECRVVLPFDEAELSAECTVNLRRLPVDIPVLRELPEVDGNAVIIDALLGIGIGRQPVHGAVERLVSQINGLPNKVIAIDLPSGMLPEFENAGRLMVHADVTLTLEFPKVAQLLPEAGEWCGRLVVLPIKLNRGFIEAAESRYSYITANMVRAMMKPRKKFSHKGTYGHSLLICGSSGMMGAAVLSTLAALRSGCGLVTAHVPFNERIVMQIACPGATLSLDEDGCFSHIPADLAKYSAIGVGCGLGQARATVEAMGELLKHLKSVHFNALVIDADAINIIAGAPELLQYVPEGAILTPHPGELKRLTGEWSDDRHKIELVAALAAKTGATIVIKGAHTMVCSPDGEIAFNSTGTPGMAKGGAGDILTGLLVGLRARGYTATDAAKIGIYLHGLAGELCARQYGEEAMTAEDIICLLPDAMLAATCNISPLCCSTHSK